MNKQIYETTNQIRRASKSRPRTLVTPVPATVRDLMNFEHGTKIKWEVYINEQGKKYIKISKIDKD